MPDILSESYCERCGSRYSFELQEAPRRGTGIKRARLVARGLKQYVTAGRAPEDATGLAIAEERGAAADQLRAFHDTFSFCFECRQYACRNCWNEAEGRCLTCAPTPDSEMEAEAAAAAEAAALQALLEAAAERVPEPEVWPTADLAATAALAAEREAEEQEIAEREREERARIETEAREAAERLAQRREEAARESARAAALEEAAAREAEIRAAAAREAAEREEDIRREA